VELLDPAGQRISGCIAGPRQAAGGGSPAALLAPGAWWAADLRLYCRSTAGGGAPVELLDPAGQRISGCIARPRRVAGGGL